MLIRTLISIVLPITEDPAIVFKSTLKLVMALVTSVVSPASFIPLRLVSLNNPIVEAFP